MPPRYAYWTILAGGLPTSFRAADKDELLPTFRRIKERQPDAEMKYFARGKLWDSAEDARRAGKPQARFSDRPPTGASGKDRERRGRDWRPGGEHRDPRQPFKDAKKAGNQARRDARWTRKNERDRPRERPHGDPLSPLPERKQRFEGSRHGRPDRREPQHGRRPESRTKPRHERPEQPRKEWREPRAREDQARGAERARANQPPRQKPHGDKLRPDGPRREFKGSRDRRFDRNQYSPPRPPRPNREPPPGREPVPEPPPRPSEPAIRPPGPPERGETPTTREPVSRRRRE